MRRRLTAIAIALGCGATASAAVIIDMQMLHVRGGGFNPQRVLTGLTVEEVQAAVKDLSFAGLDRKTVEQLIPVIQKIQSIPLRGPYDVVDDALADALDSLDSLRKLLPVPIPPFRVAMADPRLTSPFEPFTLAKHHTSLALGYAYYPFDNADDTELGGTEDYASGSLNLYAGHAFTDYLTVGVTLPVVTSADRSGEGVGDIAVDFDVFWLRYSHGAPFNFGLGFRAQLPLGDEADGTGAGVALFRQDLKLSLPLRPDQRVRVFGSAGIEGGLDERAMGAVNYAAGLIADAGKGWNFWTAFAGSHLFEDRVEPGTEPFRDLQRLRLGGAYRFASAEGERQNVVSLEYQHPTRKEGLWSWSVEATYGLAFDLSR